MGRRRAKQEALFVPHQQLRNAGHPFYAALERTLGREGFDAFVEAHPRSPLASDARFGGALAQAALGDKARAVSGFETFVKQDPQHPLARDAERALAALR